MCNDVCILFFYTFLYFLNFSVCFASRVHYRFVFLVAMNCADQGPLSRGAGPAFLVPRRPSHFPWMGVCFGDPHTVPTFVLFRKLLTARFRSVPSRCAIIPFEVVRLFSSTYLCIVLRVTRPFVSVPVGVLFSRVCFFGTIKSVKAKNVIYVVQLSE